MEAFQKLEQEFAAWMGYEPDQVVVCSSGTAALHLALEAFQLPNGSKIIMSDFNMIACPRAAALAGLEPVFVDCDKSLNMDLNCAVRAGEDAKAVMITHIYGRHCAWTGWNNVGYVVEDMAEIHGVRPSPAAHAACWSFYKNKVVCGEEGGAVAFRHRDHAELARELRSLGFTSNHDYMHTPRGHNYRMSNVHAKLILDSLANVDANLQQRRVIEEWYFKQTPTDWRMPYRASPWVYDIRIKGMDQAKCESLVQTLNRKGVAARHAFKPMSWQPEFLRCHKVSNTCEAAKASREVIYLPIFPGTTTEEDCKRAMDIVKELLEVS